ncbi:hypothetical protein LJ739_16010 [Aestuariibacter halophilus]|uniref:Uncharacterized protein n=1 Tax=Fluctibacter halophilus TaxID=226011 RepID=A0ABS8GB77_9ALTE|nr:DUF6544 family protein [Aestuariibacter halophilus]MCC2617758.1 hypothetical protein [Aestuariibacter halophilus]
MVGLIGVVVVGAVLLCLLRLRDRHDDSRAWARLASLQPKLPARFNPAMLATQAEPVQRFFNYMIGPDAPLYTVAEIHMQGQFSLGSKANPDYKAMRAKQLLAAPAGFIWQLVLPTGLRVSGSDTERWTRFRLLELLPVARLGGDPDHTLSAYGRYIAEAIIWSPAAVLPGADVIWEAINDHQIRVTVSHEGLRQTVNIDIAADGAPQTITFLRWSNANAQKIFTWQPFGAYLSDFREVCGYRLPHYVEAGNLFGTEQYFPFYKAQVTSIAFPTRSS